MVSPVPSSSPRLHAITRAVSRSLARCELTHLERTAIDVDVARRQHAAYEATLERLGCTLVRLPEERELPDSVFVEDTALALDEVAVILRPGAASRRQETASVARALSWFRPVVQLAGEGTVDGGDVLRLGRTLWVGRSSRSSEAGIAALAATIAPFGYDVRDVAIDGCLHLKSAVTAVADGLLLLNPRWVDGAGFPGCALVEVDPAEPHAANALRVGDTLVFPAAFPRTAERLEARGLHLERVDLAELAKAEGAVTCCSLVFLD